MGIPLSRSTTRSQGANATLGYEGVEQKHPFRKVNGEEISLRPLFAWINRGKVIRGGVSYSAESPMRQWHPLSGTIVSVLDDAVLLSLPLSRKAVFIKNYPKDLNPLEGREVSVVAVAAGTFDYEAKSGRKASVAVYDYGVPFTPATLPAAGTAVGTTQTLTNRPPSGLKPAKRK